MTNRHNDLIEKIIAIELEMFLAVPASAENKCQKHPEAFSLHRRAQFMPWSDTTLTSYLSDLEAARTRERNLMTEKYLIMDRLTQPEICRNPLIEKIVHSQLTWQKAMFAKYPGVMGGARPLDKSADSPTTTSFTTYLKSELKTYSDKTLILLYEDIIDQQERGMNMARATYQFLAQEAGYSSLAQAESMLSATAH